MKVQRLAERVFGFDELYPEQKEAIDAVLEGNDTLAILPTGAGKSALYQLEKLDVLELSPSGDLELDDAVNDGAQADALKRAAQEHEARREFIRSRLDMMKGYAATTTCRRAYLLGYFGETLDEPCGNCDTCLASKQPNREHHSQDADNAPFALGSRVTHSHFGEGQVTHYEADKMTVLFNREGYQTLLTELVVETGLLEPLAA